MIKDIKGLSKEELRKIKFGLRNLMLDLNKDLKKSLNNFDYDEVKIDIQLLDDYSRLLEKIAWNILYGSEK